MKKELSLAEQTHRTKLKDLYASFCVTVILFRVLDFSFDFLHGLFPSGGFYIDTLVSVLLRAAALLIPFFVYRRACRDPFSALFRSRNSESRGAVSLFSGISVIAFAVGATTLTEWILRICDRAGLHSAATPAYAGLGIGQTVFSAVVSAIVLGFAYEFSFRAILLSAAKEENRTAAVFVSALCFALSDGDVYHILPRFLFGAVLAVFWLKTESLVLCAVFGALTEFSFALIGSALSDLSDLSLGLISAIALIVGVVGFVLLIRREKTDCTESVPRRLAFRQMFASFGVYVLVALTAFGLLVNTFSTDSDPADPLLQPTPEQGRQEPLHFDRGEELGDESDSDLD